MRKTLIAVTLLAFLCAFLLSAFAFTGHFCVDCSESRMLCPAHVKLREIQVFGVIGIFCVFLAVLLRWRAYAGPLTGCHGAASLISLKERMNH